MMFSNVGTGKNLASLEVVPCFGIEMFSRSDHFQSLLALHLDTELNPMNQVRFVRQTHYKNTLQSRKLHIFAFRSHLDWSFCFESACFHIIPSGIPPLASGCPQVLKRCSSAWAPCRREVTRCAKRSVTLSYLC